MIDCRLVPRPEISTPSRGRESLASAITIPRTQRARSARPRPSALQADAARVVAHGAIAGDNRPQAKGVRFARSGNHFDHFRRVARGGYDDEPHAHVEGAEHLSTGNRALLLDQTE